MTSPNFFGRCHKNVGRCHNRLGEVINLSMTESALKFTFHVFSQLIWEKSFCFLTSPNFFGRCHENVGRCHNRLGEVINFSMTESALNINFFRLLPTFLGEVIYLFDFSQLIWEMSVRNWEMS